MTIDTSGIVIRKRSASGRWRRVLRDRAFVLGLVVVVIALVGAVGADMLARYPLGQVDLLSANQPPSATHWLGTDALGRDMYSQLLFGARTSLYVGVVSAAIATLLGVVLGGIAGYLGRFVDAALVRASELVLAFPNLILVLILVSLVGASVNNLVLVFALTGWMGTFRIVRGEFMSLKHEPFVDAARTLGLSGREIIFRQILPSVASPILVAASIKVAQMILSEAALSFLGLGVPVTTPTWGNLLAAAQSTEVLRNYWWIWVIPGLVICLFSISVNFIADGLRDFLDPQAKK